MTAHRALPAARTAVAVVVALAGAALASPGMFTATFAVTAVAVVAFRAGTAVARAQISELTARLDTLAAAEVDAPVLDRPVPGPGAAALTTSMDRLRASIRAARAEQDRLADTAARDAMTGLLNRAGFADAADTALGDAHQAGTAVAVLYVDLDGLKAINDRYGHAAGDAAIQTATAALGQVTRDGDVVGRVGGDEFLIVAPVAGPDPAAAAAALAERVRAAVSARPVTVTGNITETLRCSVGVALTGPATRSCAQLAELADQALYTAKRAGRDQISLAATVDRDAPC